MKLVIVVVLALTGALTSDTARTRIEIADVPGQQDALYVAWDELPGVPAGAMVYRADRGSDETRYFAVGGGGHFAIVDRGQHTLVAGTLVPVFEIVVDDPAHPQRMRLDTARKVDATALAARYAAFEQIAAPGETRAAIEAAITARAAKANKACGTKLAPQLDWAAFQKAGKLALAKQAIALYDAIEATCGDADYRAALRALGKLEVRLGGDGLALAVQGGALAATLSETGWNPRETATVWLRKNL